MSGPPKPHTRDLLLDATVAALIARGYAGCSVQEICDAAGLSKGAFFHCYESKADAALNAVDRFADTRLRQMQAVADRAGLDPRARVFGLIDGLISVASDTFLTENCLLGVLGQEAPPDSQVAARVAARLRRWADWVGQELAGCDLPLDVEAVSLGQHLIAVFEGGLLLSRAAHDPAPLRASLSHYRRYLISLLGVPALPSPVEQTEPFTQEKLP